MKIEKMACIIAITASLAVSGVAQAKDAQSNRLNTDVLRKPAHALTAEDMLQYLDLALTEAITPEQARTFLSSLSPLQLAQLDESIVSLGEKKMESSRALYEAGQNQARLGLGEFQRMMACDPAAQAKGFCWLQLIERYKTSVIIEHKRPAWHQRYTTICDDDPRDTDLVVYFPITSINPDNLMWGSTSSWLTTIMSVGQNGFDFDNVGAHMCIEDRASSMSNLTDAQIANSLTLYLKR